MVDLEADLRCGSVTLLLERAKNGDGDAANDLLAAYIPELLRIARELRIAKQSTVRSGSDFVMSACAKLWLGFVRGRLQSLTSRENLWPLLIRMTVQEAQSHARAELSHKRGQGEAIQASVLPSMVLESGRPVHKQSSPTRASSVPLPNDRVGPSHELLAELDSVTAFREFLETLPEDLRYIAVLRLLGYRNAEIAACRRCAERSVERKLALIRDYMNKQRS